MTGMKRMIIFCIGSVGAGFIDIWIAMVTNMRMGRMLIGSSKPKRGMVKMVSGSARSLIQRNFSWRNSTALLSMVKRPKKIGICANMGRHPATGLIPYSEKSFICSCCTFWGSSGYLSLSSLILGWSLAIRFDDLIEIRVSGHMMVLIRRVRQMMESPHASPPFSLVKTRLWKKVRKLFRMPEIGLKKP